MNHTFHRKPGETYEQTQERRREHVAASGSWKTRVFPTTRGAHWEDADLPRPYVMWEVVCDHDECGGVVRCVGDEQQARALAELHGDHHSHTANSYSEGDRDTTPDDDALQCCAEWPVVPFRCTRYNGHDGDHAAGNGDVIVKVWGRRS